MTPLHTRPATLADTAAIAALVTAGERALGGGVDATVEDIAANLARPAIDLARDTLVVLDPAGTMAGWAWVHRGRRAAADVHPAHLGRGLGTRLLAWTERRATEWGSQRLGQNVRDDNPAAVALLRASGYERLATAWLLVRDLTGPVEPVEPPAGIAIRAFRAGDERATHELVEAAFGEWQQRPREYAEWAQLTVERATFAPALSPLAFDGDRLVGAVLSLDRGEDGYVERVAVHGGYRRRGIAQALLLRAFHDFAWAGRRACALWTHSDTGALPLYERLGMTVRRTSSHLSRALT